MQDADTVNKNLIDHREEQWVEEEHSKLRTEIKGFKSAVQ